ncbi:MAG TPA: response regulator transcription factor [Myxococcota bacterium]|nr:response regulator transcription factor [Myxococcota bacterium]
MKILVCDDHALFREGVVHALRELERGAEVVEAADGAQALELAGQHADLDLVLLDLHMPGTDGWTGLARLQQACPTLPIVILSASEDPADARRAIEAGAAGFVTKSTRGPVLRAALSLVLSGGVYLPPHVLVHEAASVSPGAASGAKSRRAAESLTERQLEVLRLMSRGLTNAEIGEVLGVAIGTVKTHIGAIFEALDVSNRTEAALVMRDLGLDQER